MKKCPKCEANYISDDEDICAVCKSDNKNNIEFNFIKNTKRNDIIKIGDIFPLSKNSQLINYLTGKNIDNWPQATYKLTDTYYMWIIALDGVVRSGWKDVLLKDGRIKENYIGDISNLPSNFSKTFSYKYKAVFEKNDDNFIFKGVYKLDIDNTTLFERYYVKVADESTLCDF